VAYGQDHYLLAIEVVKSNISTLPELHHPLTKLWQHVFDRPADLGMFAKRLDAAPDRLHRTPGSIRAFWCQEGMETGYIQQSRVRPD
jgi:hypothetical protein